VTARRVRLMLGVLAVAVVGGLAGAAPPKPAAAAGTAPTSTAPTSTTPIQHVVFTLQSNHSFDNYFGTRPGADGPPSNACQPVTAGKATPCVRPFALASGTDTTVLRDSARIFSAQNDGGRLDGFVSAYTAQGANGRVAMGHYTRQDLPYYNQLADTYTLFDRYFSSAPSGGVANHMYAVAAQPGNATARGYIPAGGWGSTPTIFDALNRRGISWKYYVQNYEPQITYRTSRKAHPDRAAQVVRVPLLGFARFVDDKRLAGHIVDLNQYYVDLANGTLPQVSYIAMSGANEHPPASIQVGQKATRSVISALERSSAWSSSAFVLAWDNWGGWYDHVKPPTGYGFRVPALVISPYARRGYLDPTVTDHTSVLKFIETNWKLPALTARDRNAGSIAGAFDFTKPPRPAELLSTRGPTDLSAGIKRGRVYGIYGGTVALVALFIGFTVWVEREARRRGSGTPAREPS
jgi:phospholipase C